MELSLKEMGAYLKQLREKAGLSTREVYLLAKVSNSYLSLVENGHRRASAVVLKRLAPVYDVDYLDLYVKAGYADLAKIENKEEKIDSLGNPIISIPILGTVKAGYDYMARENWEGTIDVEKSIIGNGEDYFALRVHGQSMSPVLVEGDIVIVKKQNDFENGDIVVAIINGDEATIKKGKKNETSILLQPFNPSYEPLIFTNEEMKTIPIEIIGVVKQLKREF